MIKPQFELKNTETNLLDLNNLNECPLLIRILHEQFTFNNENSKLFLPNLSVFGNQQVGIFSDYSGETNGSYYTYSVLVCAMGVRKVFTDRMKEIRELYKLGMTEISFKDLRTAKIRNALSQYLESLDNLVPGFLVTLAVDKKILTLIGPSKQELVPIIEAAGLGKWDQAVVEKLLRIVHLTAYLAALLASDGQKILWMTDHDNIAPNSEKFNKTLLLFDHLLHQYAKSNTLFPTVGGALPFQERSPEIDLLSAADLAASTLADYLTKRDVHLVNGENIEVKDGAMDVLRWLLTDSFILKKVSMIMQLDENGEIKRGTINLAEK